MVGGQNAPTVTRNAPVSAVERRWRRSTSQGGTPMPARTEKQRRFMGAELQRKREGKKTRTGMSESELEKMASKPKGTKKQA